MSLFLIDVGTPVVFVHIPKTGGTSIRSPRQMSQCALYEPNPLWAHYPSFAFVRDPFDRLESCWRDFSFLRPATNLGFEAFVDFVNRPGIDARIDSPTTIEHHAAPMTHPVHGLQHAKWIGRYDRLQDDFDRFLLSLGLDPFRLLHERNGGLSPRAPRTDSALALVRKYYAQDYAWLTARDERQRINFEMAT